MAEGRSAGGKGGANGAGGAAQRRGHKRDIIAVVVIVAVVACLFVGSRLVGGTSDGGEPGDAQAAGVARITDGDGATYEMPLDQNGTTTVTSSYGTNVVEVADGRVRVREADCPNQDCVNQGWIDSSSQQIVCLPHKLYIDVVNGEQGDYDVVGR